MKPRTVVILLAVAVLFIAFVTHPHEMAFVLGAFARRVANVFHG